jgi:predicted TIM-barrel fold metal-dependent hydrolase
MVCAESPRLRAVVVVQLHDIPEEADESLIPTVAAMIGEDVLLYAFDYPYWDMDYPDSAKELWECTDLSERAKRKILGENAQQVYGLK